MIYKNTDKLDLLDLQSNNFYVLMDFDRTITTSDSFGSWSVLENPDFINENLKIESKQLLDKYYPYEINYSIDFDTKLQYITEWYHKNMDLFYKYNLTHDALINCVKYSNMHFRNGFKEFLKILYNYNIPVITEFMKLNDCLYNNIYIMSNFISFEHNHMIKFSDKMIHSLNKTINSLPDNYKEFLSKRDYCLLFGDLIEDLYMIPKNNLKNCISFGFLEQNIAENFNIYKKSFDYVLTDNSSYFDIINILKNRINIFKR